MTEQRIPVMSERSMSWAYRTVWALCTAVYVLVFVSGVQAGGSDLNTLIRAMGFTLAIALVGKLGLAILSRATQPLSATEEGTVGSLVDLLSSPNVSELEDEAEAA